MAFQGIINRGSSVSLDVHRPDIAQNGATVQQWDYLSNANQHWEFVDAGGGWFWLRNQERGKALDVHRPDISLNGARVQQWDYLGNPNQQWKAGGNTGSDRFVVGPFDFDPAITPDQVCTLFERHRFAFSQVGGCGNLNANERQTLTQAYQRAIWHGVDTDPDNNASAIVGGSQIWVNFGNLFPQGAVEIAQTLIHEMMHCAGFPHPVRRRPPAGMNCAAPNPALFDCPFDNGQYYGTPPLRAELCIAGNQSDVVRRVTEKAGEDYCVINDQGIASIHRA